jgi:hypothetical protein
MASQKITTEGIEAVAASLGLERVEHRPPDPDLPADEALAEGLQRIVEG